MKIYKRTNEIKASIIFFKPKSFFRQRLNFAGNIWAELTRFVPHLSSLAPRLCQCLSALPHAATAGPWGALAFSPEQQQPGPWQYLGISAGLGNPAHMDSLSSLKNRWRVQRALTSPRRKPGSTGWSTLWKEMGAKSHFSSKVAQCSLRGWDRPGSRNHLLSVLAPGDAFPAKEQVLWMFFSTLKRKFWL